ncbi:unnamed protein product [Protopolystoma xenopodis]|uniref:Uncharacterized protein n=1 Tax=Protopolystoma xenopodis TaxID=117903 RepID=A0A448XT06_9PLAT|nr:unnamed protein product [Protopolystoma xenopodis]
MAFTFWLVGSFDLAAAPNAIRDGGECVEGKNCHSAIRPRVPVDDFHGKLDLA